MSPSYRLNDGSPEGRILDRRPDRLSRGSLFVSEFRRPNEPSWSQTKCRQKGCFKSQRSGRVLQCSDDQRQGTAWVGGAARSKGRDNVEILSMSPRQSDCSTFTTRRPNETSSRRMTPSHNVLIDTVLTLGVVRRVGGAARSKGRHGVEILSMSPRQSDSTTFTTR